MSNTRDIPRRITRSSRDLQRRNSLTKSSQEASPASVNDITTLAPTRKNNKRKDYTSQTAQTQTQPADVRPINKKAKSKVFNFKRRDLTKSGILETLSSVEHYNLMQFLNKMRFGKLPNKRSTSTPALDQLSDSEMPSLDIDITSPSSSPSLGPMHSPFSMVLSPSSHSDASSLSSPDEDLFSSQLSGASSSSDASNNLLGLPVSHAQSGLFSSPSHRKVLFPDLFVLNQIYNRVQTAPLIERPDFSNIVFACGQHLLNTTGSLFRMLLKLGARSENIFVIGKSYSNSAAVISGLKSQLDINNVYEGTPRDEWGNFAKVYSHDVHDMWRDIEAHVDASKSTNTPIKDVIVLDDGGHVLEEMTSKIRATCKCIGIEQTSSGIGSAKRSPFPVIQVASSAIKNWCEPPMVSQRVALKVKEKITEILGSNPALLPLVKYGIVGFGHIGKAILEELRTLPAFKSIIIFDRDPLINQEAKLRCAEYPNVKVVDSIDSLFIPATVVIGCTGKDITLGKLDIINSSNKSMALISCSSKDNEFHSLLEQQQLANPAPKDPLRDVIFSNEEGHMIRIIKGGLPVNFDNSPYSVPPKEIQVIRGLKLAAVLQAYTMLQDWARTGKMELKAYQVDANMQQWIFQEWIKTKPSEKCWKPFVALAANVDEIIRVSGGVPYESPALELVQSPRLSRQPM